MSSGHGYSMGGHGSMMTGVNGRMGDSKQRKRRGNLPKETTDKLRAWFSEHLHHPYPSEDEKQDLMTQTGLQMSKLILALMSLYLIFGIAWYQRSGMNQQHLSNHCLLFL